MATAKPTVLVTTEFCERTENAHRLGGIAEATIRGYVYHHTGYNMAEADALYLAGIVATCVEQEAGGDHVHSHADALQVSLYKILALDLAEPVAIGC